MPQAHPMQISAHRKGFLSSLVVTAALGVVTVLGATGPAVAAGAGRIGPGTQLVTAGRTCTANFVFRDARHRVFVGYAASCATRTATSGPSTCTARPLPLGTRVRFADHGRTLGYGELRYSSLRALRRAGITDAATCANNDFALVEVRGSARRRVDPTVPYWGGPSGLGALPAIGSTVFGLARPTAGARTIPRAGAVTVAGSGAITVTTPLPSTRGARGSGFLDSSGHAVGILTTSTSTGENTVVGLAAAVVYARAHGVAGLRVVHGHDAFSGSAIL
jgi:hypothetical protein